MVFTAQFQNHFRKKIARNPRRQIIFRPEKLSPPNIQPDRAPKNPRRPAVISTYPKKNFERHAASPTYSPKNYRRRASRRFSSKRIHHRTAFIPSNPVQNLSKFTGSHSPRSRTHCHPPGSGNFSREEWVNSNRKSHFIHVEHVKSRCQSILQQYKTINTKKRVISQQIKTSKPVDWVEYFQQKCVGAYRISPSWQGITTKINHLARYFQRTSVGAYRIRPSWQGICSYSTKSDSILREFISKRNHLADNFQRTGVWAYRIRPSWRGICSCSMKLDSIRRRFTTHSPPWGRMRYAPTHVRLKSNEYTQNKISNPIY